MSGRTVVTRRPETGELVVERVVAAAPPVVWRCWTTEEVRHWWGPRGWTAQVHGMDVRPGGHWHYSLAPDDGHTAPVHCLATYQRVEPPRLLGFLDGFLDDEGTVVDGSAVPTAVELLAATGGTHLTITVTYPDAAALRAAETTGMVEGLSEALDRLDDHVNS